MSHTVLAMDEATVRGARGAVFGPISTESHSPITLVIGGRGTGRTSMLLTLSGRMRLSDGSLSVMGIDSSSRSGMSQIRSRVGIAGFEGIDELEPQVTVGDTLRERYAWAMPWWRSTPKMTPALTAELLGEAFGEYELPSPDTLVRDLVPASEMLLRIALAQLEQPEVICLDNFDWLRNPAERALVGERLRAIAARGTRIIAGTSDPQDAVLLEADTVIEL